MGTEHAAYSVLLKAVKEVMEENEALKLQSTIAAGGFEVGRKMYQWLQDSADNITRAQQFAESMIAELKGCIPSCGAYKSFQARREWMWTNYHQLRCSTTYTSAWKTFLCGCIATPGQPIYWQSVGDKMFHSILKTAFPVNSVTVRSEVDGDHEAETSITDQEVKALRYAAGYVPRAIRHKLQTQNMRPLKEQLLLCMYDLLDDGDEESVPSAEWIDLLNRGGLTHVNELTFQVFLAMELEFRKHLSAQKTPNFN